SHRARLLRQELPPGGGRAFSRGDSVVATAMLSSSDSRSGSLRGGGGPAGPPLIGENGAGGVRPHAPRTDSPFTSSIGGAQPLVADLMSDRALDHEASGAWFWASTRVIALENVSLIVPSLAPRTACGIVAAEAA